MNNITTINKFLILLSIFLMLTCWDSNPVNEKIIYGCTDLLACNYSLNSNADDDSCYYADEYYDCNNVCWYDIDVDEVCDDADQCWGDDASGNEDGDGYCNDVDMCWGDDDFGDEDGDALCDNIDPCIAIDNGYNDEGYYCEDLHVLQDFINENSSLDSLDIFDIIETSWFNDDGRLDYLSLAELSLTSVPESIGILNNLERLYLNGNQLSSIPETICNIPSSCQIFIQYNNLCEEYDYDCINQFEPQDCNE